MPVFDTTPRKLGALIMEHEKRRRNEVSGAVRASARNAAKIIKANAPRATLRLYDSIRVVEHGETAEVVVDAPHAQAVEIGSRPHMPPVKPLIEWAEAIGAEDPRDTAWAVARKIQREGTRPKWFVRSSIPAIMQATGLKIRYVLTK